MSEFYLAIRDRTYFRVTKGDVEPIPKTDVILGRRDPEVPLEWKTGSYYYNPFYEKRNAFIYRGDQTLATLLGRQVGPKGLKKPYNRTWFEILPLPLELVALPVQLKSMINAIPGQVKIISQSVMHYLSVRVPPEFNPVTSEDWYTWLKTVQVPMNAMLKQAIERAQDLLISRETEAEFLHGTVIVPGIELKLKMFEFREVTKKVREIRESAFVTVRVPQDIIAKGRNAVKAFLEENSLTAKFPLENEAISERVLETKTSSRGPVEMIGWYYDTQQHNWTNLWGPELYTENDVIREILAENEN